MTRRSDAHGISRIGDQPAAIRADANGVLSTANVRTLKLRLGYIQVVKLPQSSPPGHVGKSSLERNRVHLLGAKAPESIESAPATGPRQPRLAGKGLILDTHCHLGSCSPHLDPAWYRVLVVAAFTNDLHEFAAVSEAYRNNRWTRVAPRSPPNLCWSGAKRSETLISATLKNLSLCWRGRTGWD